MTNKIICYVKYKGTNLSTITNVFKQIINYYELGTLAPFEGGCSSHAFLKTCQYAIFGEKLNSGLQHVNMKFAQSSIQTYITWPKKLGKKRVGWKKKSFGYKFVTTKSKHINENKVYFQNSNVPACP